MATIILSCNAGNKLIDSILSSVFLAGASIVKRDKIKTKQLTPFEESLEDIKYGRVTKIKNIDNVLEEILQ